MLHIGARAFLRWEPLGVRTAFTTARQTVLTMSRSSAAQISRAQARTFASRSHQAPTWQQYAPAGAFCTVAALTSYYAVTAELAAAVVDVKEFDGPMTITVSAGAKGAVVQVKDPESSITITAVENEPAKKSESKSIPSLENIDLIVCDMAGTTVMEGGVVYKTLRAAMNADGLDVSEEEMHAWHGAKKEAVIAHFAKEHGSTSDDQMNSRVKRVSKIFVTMLDEAYFGDASPVRLIAENLKDWIYDLQARGTLVALDTGYPPKLQMDLMKKLGLDRVVNGKVSSYEVKEGRPAPFMIFKLMEDFGVFDVKRVAKVGDTVRDIQEGRNAGCGLVVGVLSGADSEEELLAAGADIVVPCITDLAVPLTAAEKMRFR